jgi:hypothetical protein
MEEQAKLETALHQLKKRGEAFAQAERDYKIALRVEILKLRDEGQPATLVLNLCYGTPNIANLRMQRDIAEALYKSALEAINIFKLKIRVMTNQYDKEYGNTQ